jgi:chromosome segregation ATPase
MKSFLVNLLVVLSLILCSFNAYQWFREAKLHGQIQGLGADIFKKSGEIQNLQQTVQVHQEEIKRLENIRENFNALVKSNRLIINTLEEQTEKLRHDVQIQTAKAAQVDQYKTAYEKANEGIVKANEVIQQQNERMKGLAEERNQFVERSNKLTLDYKSLAEDYQKVLGLYTNLVAQVNAANEKNSRR